MVSKVQKIAQSGYTDSNCSCSKLFLIDKSSFAENISFLIVFELPISMFVCNIIKKIMFGKIEELSVP